MTQTPRTDALMPCQNHPAMDLARSLEIELQLVHVYLTERTAERDKARAACVNQTVEISKLTEERDNIKQAHANYVAGIRDELGMETPGDGFREFLRRLKTERDEAMAALEMWQWHIDNRTFSPNPETLEQLMDYHNKARIT